ncbi:MAG: RT0821/Lpp0805 family surface protein [Gammaproteobacteria bacterium]|jgi:surface antigen
MKTLNNKILTTSLIAIIIASTGCATNSYSERQSVGAVTGAALGGLLGAQFGGRGGSDKLATTAAGVFIGGLLGSEVGRSMDEVDRLKANEANNRAQAAPIGEKITWNNPQSRNSGTITPTREGSSESGDYCREFYQTVSIAGSTENAYGVACQKPDGTWRIAQN